MRTQDNQPLQFVAMHVLLFVLAITVTTSATADVYYVGKSGSNTNSCTAARSRSTAKLTIVEGIRCLKSGDTLYIGTGTYPETLDSNTTTIPSGTAWTSVVTIAAYPGEKVTLNPSGTTAVINLAHAYIQYVVFDGLVLDATAVASEGLSLTNGAHHIRFQNGEENAIGQIQLVSFVNEQGLLAAGAGLYKATPASVPPLQGIPGENSMGTLSQAALEGSNVNVAQSMVDMIKTQRAYEMGTKVISTVDQMMGKVIDVKQ